MIGTTCKYCGERAEQFVSKDIRATFYRCAHCLCESSDMSYSDVVAEYHKSEYLDWHDRRGSNQERFLNELNTNMELIQKHAPTPGKFLDVGCCEGSALKRMTDIGWDVYGFDIIAECPTLVGQYGIPPDKVKVGDSFHRATFYKTRFDCVMSREVLEHVPNVDRHMDELVAVVAKGGVIQVQTPRPCTDTANRYLYQDAHLILLQPFCVRRLLESRGMTVLDSLLWDTGQCWTARKD